MIPEINSNLGRRQELFPLSYLAIGGGNGYENGRSASKKKRIVIVDDDSAVRTAYREALSRMGFEVLAEMSDGREVVEKIESINPRTDVVLMDERMPRMTGIEACAALRAKFPDLKIIFVSADAGARQRAIDAGANDFIAKPASMRDIARAIERS